MYMNASSVGLYIDIQYPSYNWLEFGFGTCRRVNFRSEDPRGWYLHRFCSDAQTEQIYTQPAEDARKHTGFNAARSAHVPDNYPSASPMVPMRLGHSSSKATASPAKLLAPADDPCRAAVSVDTGFSARHVVHVTCGGHGAALGAF